MMNYLLNKHGRFDLKGFSLFKQYWKLWVHGVEVVDIVAAEEEDEGPHDELHRIAGSVKVPDGGGRPEAHGHVHPECDSRRRWEEGGAVLRSSHRPLSIRIQHVVAEGEEVGVFLGHAPSQVDEVADGVVSRHVVCFHCGVVSRAPPVFPAPGLDVPRVVLLFLLHDREGRHCQELVGRGVEEHVASADVGQRHRVARPIGWSPEWAHHSAQPLLVDQQLLGVL